MLTRNLTINWDGAAALLKTFQLTGELEQVIDATIPAGADTQLVVAVDVSAITGLILIADKDCTIETNSGGAPVNTFTLTAGRPFLYVKSGTLALRDTANTAVVTDITSLYVTAAEQVNLAGRILTDATP